MKHIETNPRFLLSRTMPKMAVKRGSWMYSVRGSWNIATDPTGILSSQHITTEFQFSVHRFGKELGFNMFQSISTHFNLNSFGTEVGPGLAVWVPRAPKLWIETAKPLAQMIRDPNDPRPPHLSEFDDFSGTDGKPLESLCNIRHGGAWKCTEITES